MFYEKMKGTEEMGRGKTLPIRMQTLVEKVPASDQVIDVGADHGWMSVALAAREDVGRVLATDISSASLQKLRDLLPTLPLLFQKKILPFVTDGFHGIPVQQVDTILIAGMGGSLMQHILEDTPEVSEAASCWVLSPQSGVKEFRRFLQRKGYEVEEDLVEEGGIFYPIFTVFLQKTVLDTNPYGRELDDWEAEYGPLLIRERHPVLLRQLTRDRQALQQLFQQLEGRTEHSVKKKREEIALRMSRIEKVL